jgi:hypothetical protein
VTQEEVAYYFITLVLGLLNGLRMDDRWMVGLLNAVLIAMMLVIDSPRLRARSQRRIVTLDVVHDDDVALVADLERRLGGRVVRHQVDEVDYVRDTMIVDVRYQTPGTRTRVAEPEPTVATAVAL